MERFERATGTFGPSLAELVERARHLEDLPRHHRRPRADLLAEGHRLRRDDVARRREQPRAPQDRGAGLRDRHRFRCAAVVGLVDADLAEVVQQCRGLELLELVSREGELGRDRRAQVSHPLGVTFAHHAPELGRGAERMDRLVVGATDDLEVLVRVPGREQRDREHDRAPQPHAAAALDAEVAHGHERRTGDQREIRGASVHRDRELPLSHHARDLGHRERRHRGERQRGEHLRPRHGQPEHLLRAAVHECGGHALDEALEEQCETSLDGRGLVADEKRREQRDKEHERGFAERGAASEDDHEGERDRDGLAVGRSQHDELTGGDRAADQCERRPTGTGLRELRAQRHRRAPAEENEDPGPPVHAPAACSSGTRSPRPADPVPASGGATAHSCSSTSWPSP